MIAISVSLIWALVIVYIANKLIKPINKAIPVDLAPLWLEIDLLKHQNEDVKKLAEEAKKMLSHAHLSASFSPSRKG